MNITHIKIKMFKGIKEKTVEFGEKTTLTAMNRKGKTTVYDAFYWLLFGKDSDGKPGTGKGAFSIHPLDENNNVIHGLVTDVEGVVDGVTLKKQIKEKKKRDGSYSYETSCWYNGSPKKIGEYQTLISAMIPETTFKLLTNLRHFNELHWEDRRTVLCSLDPTIEQKLDEIRKASGGLTLEEQKKVLSDKRKLLKKDRDDITPRMDEIQAGLEDYAADADLSTKREVILADLGLLSQNREEVHSNEVARQLQLDEISSLERDKGKREGELKSDTSGIKELLREKIKIVEQVAGFKADVVATETEIKTYEADMHRFKDMLEGATKILQEIREKYTAASTSTTDCKCYACGQSLPEHQVKTVEEKREKDLQKLIAKGNAAKQGIADTKSNMEGCQAKFEDSTTRLNCQKQQVDDAEKYKTARFAEIQTAIDGNVTPQPMMDDKWKQLSAKITALESEVGVDVASQIKDIDDQIQTKQDDLAELDKSLAQADRSAKDKKRIDELSAEEKKLSQEIADLDKETCEVEKYQAEVSKMIEDKVNGKFQAVRFKLFNPLLNGSVEPCCVSLLDGRPYPDMSNGEKIYVGIDIRNTLCEHHGHCPPLFIDNAESYTPTAFTPQIEPKGQTISLYADENVKELTVEAK